MKRAFQFINSVLQKTFIYKLRAVNSYDQDQSLYFTFYKEMWVWGAPNKWAAGILSCRRTFSHTFVEGATRWLHF